MAENEKTAIFGATKFNSGFVLVFCGVMICAVWVGASAGGRPRCSLLVFSDWVSSTRISSRLSLLLTARTNSKINHP
ncbi:hypothetical protein DIJ64_11480 [Mycobacterium leprae]|uniref:Uncharacterized protein n=1 Tax=Mycobacterium leprae TaxID=1769 RepID=A0AAD0P9E1_MYCLR|nr:hypothetical protein [Mycobacterium leprae]AWV48458.1 hypothetical protein DIJ64_11480 [Mycobacterium leprae]OAR20183.1 hypothetical protein A8144_11855 [Mycobacterium leprae 3125609]OAX70557.1 hypothetical protein A3216_11250 [Mycobacterium leprae 7935681]